MLRSRERPLTPDAPMRITAWKLYCSAFSRTALRLSAVAW